MKLLFLIIPFLLVKAIDLQAQYPNWQNKDLNIDSVFGISTEKLYNELLVKKTSKTVIVAVIDCGVDTAHEKLIDKLWNNPNEKKNGIDDDKNGYVDDLHGWNFIGGREKNIEYDNYEMTRLIRRDQEFYDSLFYTGVPAQYRVGYRMYRKLRNKFDQKLQQAQRAFNGVDTLKTAIEKLLKNLSNAHPDIMDLKNYHPKTEYEKEIISIIIKELELNPDFTAIKKRIDYAFNYSAIELNYHLNLKYDPRYIVGDEMKNNQDRYYGSNDVMGPSADHGTHVAGIIAAARGNCIEVVGVAENTLLMCLRVVPNGDERDKDVANAIRYAVDNGAKIINMSFGKPYSWDKKIVDEAVMYAMQRDVLLIHASGNDGKNLDDPENGSFPNKYYSDSTGEAKSWINVGASGWIDDSTLVAPFSNYGKTKVDVFAPGVRIYSTMPGSKYDYLDGTSMAAPVVTGIAALIREYYPKLTALQVKEIIMKSVIKRDVLKDKCVTGGVVNAYEALKLAATYKNK